MSSPQGSKYIKNVERFSKGNLFLLDDKLIRAAEIAEAKITGKETPASDPHKKADAENIGHLSGDQSTCAETPVAPVGATVGSST